MIVRIKDITGTLYKFKDVDKMLENYEQIILRFEDKSECIFIAKNIIYALRDRDIESEDKNESI